MRYHLSLAKHRRRIGFADSSALAKITALPFVDSVKLVWV